MLLGWLNARQAAQVGIALADHFAPDGAPNSSAQGKKTSRHGRNDDAMRRLLQRAEQEVRPLQLNFYKKAKLANSFKWRLLENGVEKGTADEVTQSLVMHLSLHQTTAAVGSTPPTSTGRSITPPDADEPASLNLKQMQFLADDAMRRQAYGEAAPLYENMVRLRPRHAVALNNWGAALCKLGRYQESEVLFRRAIAAKPSYADAHSNLGTALLMIGQSAFAVQALQRALKLNAKFLDARLNMGFALLSLGRPSAAKAHFEKALKLAPCHVEALKGAAQVAATEGSFDEAETTFRRALKVNPNDAGAWASLAGLRKMTPSDRGWLERAEQILSGNITPTAEASLRFAIGKYCDDVGDFKQAFQNYQRANKIRKSFVPSYNPEAYRLFVDDLIRVYTPERCARVSPSASTSMKPVFVVGMMRSGTSLVEQIIASHPLAVGAGELDFWLNAVRERESAIRQDALAEPTIKQLVVAYLELLERYSADATRVVDKAPVNSDYLGPIHSVFPRARIVYLRRHPIDTCLSCYFQEFSTGLTFAMDLSDLAHHYQQHYRLINHWRAVLPAGSILDVPYAGLVAEPEAWTRKILDFLGVEWDPRCLQFQRTKRTVATASSWQVRQPIYKSSVERWRNYRKFIGPLRELQKLDW